MSVRFLKFKNNIASSRYRGEIPERELRRLGVPEGNDVLIASKHSWDWESVTKPFKRVIFDVCDDHFHDQHQAHYRLACNRADLITCNSSEMAKVIKAETGRDAVLIPDPYEQPERPAKVNDNLLWFGHRSNLPDLEREMPSLHGLKLAVVTNAPGYAQWSPGMMDEAFNRAGLVVIPTGKSLAKSGNRAIEAIRRGLFVVANPLPAYQDLGIWTGNIREGVDWALSHRAEVIKRIKGAQDYVKHEYSPARIGKLWKQALSSI